MYIAILTTLQFHHWVQHPFHRDNNPQAVLSTWEITEKDEKRKLTRPVETILQLVYGLWAVCRWIWDLWHYGKGGLHGPPSITDKINIKTAKTLHISQGKGGTSSLTMEYWCRLTAQWLFIFNVRKCKNWEERIRCHHLVNWPKII